MTKGVFNSETLPASFQIGITDNLLRSKTLSEGTLKLKL